MTGRQAGRQTDRDSQRCHTETTQAPHHLFLQIRLRIDRQAGGQADRQRQPEMPHRDDTGTTPFISADQAEN